MISKPIDFELLAKLSVHGEPGASRLVASIFPYMGAVRQAETVHEVIRNSVVGDWFDMKL